MQMGKLLLLKFGIPNTVKRESLAAIIFGVFFKYDNLAKK